MTGAVASRPIDEANAGIPSPESLIACARAMIPTLRERARACTIAHDVPKETVAGMKAGGFFRVLRRFLRVLCRPMCGCLQPEHQLISSRSIIAK